MTSTPRDPATPGGTPAAPASSPASALPGRPRLARGVRLRLDAGGSDHALLFPEGVCRLNDSAAAVLELCDGHRRTEEIISVLENRYGDPGVAADVRELLGEIAATGLVVDADA
ncbi:pyrroloquinoline quinone biosynthesis peptide chaperone PqqD [Actinomadura miaoliensis]|uniref:Pyrroloquinoline quinone biosynthesis peptide chaperone PqqD n=1 Tax=Actinomadura miaoliensis TaxID=430685 RepID=A0ABP7W2X1_9ACTN